VRKAAVGLALGILGTLMLLPSAAATTAPTARALPAPDLSTMPKIRSYLRSLGVNPKGFVIQRGAKNYAGPNCPGASWNCTTARKVVQISATATHDDDDDNGENRFVCKRNSGAGTVTPAPTPPNQSCTIVQNNPNSNNSATCDIETHGSEGTLTQTCFITQTGKRNIAYARQVARMSASGTEQDVTQTISVKQTSSGSSGNTVETTQGALLTSGPDSSSEAVVQDVHQVNCVNQDAAGRGPNVAKSGQAEALVARKHNATLDDLVVTDIAQNTAVVVAECSGPAVPFPTTFHPDTTDCAVLAVGASDPKEHANACSRIHQESDSGKNTITLGQLDSLFAELKNTSGDADIQQGGFAIFGEGDTGTTGTLDQFSSGLSNIDFNGLTTQVTSINGADNLDSFFVSQSDTGPKCCAGGHQATNTGNDFDIDGLLFQRIFVDGVAPAPGDFGVGQSFIQDGEIAGDCETSGAPGSGGGCTVDINATNNADPNGDPASCGPATSCHEQVNCFALNVKGTGGSCSGGVDITSSPSGVRRR
jgi:hypothetical protein